MLWLLLHPRWDVLHVHGHHHFDGPSLWLARLLRRPSLIKATMLFGPEGFMVPGKRLSRFVNARAVWRFGRWRGHRARTVEDQDRVARA